MKVTKKIDERSLVMDLHILMDKYGLEMTIYPDEIIIALEQEDEEDDS